MRDTTPNNLQSKADLGVLTDTEVLLIDTFQKKRVQRSLLIPPAAHKLSGLLDMLWESGLSEAWVMPGTILSQDITTVSFEQVNAYWKMLVHSDQRNGRPSSTPTRPFCVTLSPKHKPYWEGRKLALVFPEHMDWGWTLPDPTSLLATVTYIHHALGRSITNSPDLIAHQLLNDLTTRDQPITQLRTSTANLFALTDSEGQTIPIQESARDVLWQRPLTLAEERQKYLHKYSYLSRSLAACSSVLLGVRDPQYSAHGREFDGVRPGIWHTNIERAGSVFDGKRLPSGFEGEWMSTPQVKSCQDIGYRVQVKEGYYWQEAHPLLKRWSNTLWQAGERPHTQLPTYRHAQGRANTLHTIKLLAGRSITIIGQDKANGGWSRPDWQGQIIGRSRAQLFAHLVNLVRRGIMPVVIDKNSLWVVSNDPNPQTTAPSLVNKWRGYSVGYDVPLPLSSEIRSILKSSEDTEQAIKKLDELAHQL